MKLFKMKYLTTSLLILSFVYACQNDKVVAKEKTVLGKVVYLDDHSPVNNCNIKVFMYSDLSKSDIEIERTSVNSAGEFKISIPNNNTDGVKIMAYPNEILDNSEIPFEQSTIDLESAYDDENEEQVLVIEVKRTGKDQTADKTDLNRTEILQQNYPNPFNPTTKIRFELPGSSTVTLKVYTMNGSDVATLVNNEKLEKGMNEYEFNASELPSGIYIYSLNAGNYSENRKMILIK